MGAWLPWRGVLRPNEDPQHLGFWCPACEQLHVYDERWRFDGNWDKPSFAPSLRTSCGHYVPNTPRMPDGRCGWCVRAEEHGRPSICRMCHLFVTEGKIIFCPDCSHDLRGQTVEMVARDEA